MDKGQGDIYPLARDAPESARLAEQHQMATELYGQLIHSTVLPNLPKNARIADVAAGTGIWALNALEILPEAQLVAFDLSDAQFPPSPPKNVRFEVADAKKPFPESYHGTFDLVHIRALFAAMHAPDWEIVLRNVVQLLKPGGAVQWEEGDNTARCLRGSKEFHRYTGIPKLLEGFGNAMGDRRSDSFRKLPEAAANLGLQDVELDFLSSDRIPEFREGMTRQYMVALLGWAENVAYWPSDELEKIRNEIDVDLENGGYCRLDVMILVARKP